MAATRNRVILLGWLAALGLYVGLDGVPWSRDQISLWLLAPIIALTIANRGRSVGRTLRDWIPLLSLLLVYDLVRGAADEINQKVHVMGPLEAERLLFSGTVPTVWMQERWLDLGQPGLHDFVAWLIYLSHFGVALAVAAALWWSSYERFAPLARRLVATTLGAFAGYVLYPAAPPWYAAREGLLPPVERHTWGMWNHVGLEPAATIWQGGSAYANDVAAIPSLHAAYPVMLLLVFWGAGWGARIGLGLYAVAMDVVLVYGGEHYVVDLVAGWLLAVVADAGVRAWERRSTAGAGPPNPPTSDPQPARQAATMPPALQ